MADAEGAEAEGEVEAEAGVEEGVEREERKPSFARIRGTFRMKSLNEQSRRGCRDVGTVGPGESVWG